MTTSTEKIAVTEDVATLILEALSSIQLDLNDPEYIVKVNEIKSVRNKLDVDNPKRKAPYNLSGEAKDAATRALSQISIPVTHPNWIRLTEILIKARVELGIAE